MFQHYLFSVTCFLLISSFSKASMLSWLTGGNRETPQVPLDIGFPSKNPIPVSPYPEETGECAHWGHLVPPQQYSVGEGLIYSSSGGPLPGATLIGAHKRVPVGSIVAVTNMKNGNTVTVRVVPPKTPPIAGRVMDLSPEAFSQVAILSEGVFLCSVNVIETPRPRQTEIHSMPSHTFDNQGMRNPGFTSPFVRTSASSMGSFGDLEMLARNENENRY